MKTNNIPLISPVILGLSLGCTLSACDHHEPPVPPSPALSTQQTPAAEAVIIPSDAREADHPKLLTRITTSPATVPKPNAGTPDNTTVAPADDFYLRFFATGETFYTEITLEHGILSYTYFEDSQKRCTQWLKNTPCWQAEDLKTIHAPLKPTEISALQQIIESNALLNITTENMGKAQKGQRYYAQQLTIHFKNQTKNLTYQSFPNATAKPNGFAQLETALLTHAKALPH